MLRSKHSGWTWEGKRTPFGGGNPISGVTDAISNAIGTSGNGGLISSISNGIEQGAQAVGQAGVGLDKAVNNLSPMGWGLPAAIAAAVATAGASLPETEAAFMSADAANLAGQGLSQEAIAQTLAGSYGLSAEQAAAAAAAASAGGQAAATAATQALPYSEVFDASNLAQQGLSSSAIQQNLASTGLNDFLAQDMANLASQGLSPAQIGQTLAYSYTPEELAGTGIKSLATTLPGQSLGSAKNALDVAKLLKQGATSGLTNSLGKLAAGANPMGAQQLQVVRGNQNPFTYTQQQPIQDTRQAQLASLLKQG
jgi:hypothetical protein